MQERMINFANANGINNIIIIYNYCNADDRQLIKSITVDNRIKFLNVSEISYKCDDDLVNTPEDNDFDVFAEAKRACKNGGIVLFLGAGVSMSAGLPSWNDLLKKSLIDGLNAPEKDYRHIREHAYDSSIVAARYIKTIYYSNPKKDESGGIVEFNEIIRRNLYKNKKDSRLLDSICKLIKSKKIESIVTYNYDDLIEEKLASSDGPAILPISKSQDSYIQGTIPVFHVHGMLSSKEGVALDSDIILTEDEYHNIYKESYNWSTIVQLFALQYRTCFFIGLSMSDPNLRRLLDIAWNNSDKEKLKHYVFLQNEQNSIFPSPETQKIRKDIMNKFGINVVWFDSFDDLTTKIDELANFARQE